MTNFDLTTTKRQQLFQFTIQELEAFYEKTADLNVSPPLDIKTIVNRIERLNLEHPIKAQDAIQEVIDGLKAFSVHTPHPKYFGLFNPRSNFSGILADLITATLNPQLAAWSHAPYAVEIENYLIRSFGERFGYQAPFIDGVFTTGGAEANLTALLCALNLRNPTFAENGLFGLSKRPLIYCSSEVHHSIHKAAKAAGLGYSAVRPIEVNKDFKLNSRILERTIQQDLNAGFAPFMLVGTAGTTGIGAIDDLPQLAKIAQKYNLWFHVDAAYGGAAMLHPNLKPILSGIEQSDSITFDAHKWMSVPMGTSLFLTSHTMILDKTFRITAEYMPKEGNDLKVKDNYIRSIQWSRRFIGLKIYLSLLFHGWEGYQEVIGHQTAMGNYLREELVANGWQIQNKTSLPIICFTDPRLRSHPNAVHDICQKIIQSGEAWLSIYPIQGIPTFRACITNYATNNGDIDQLIEGLNKERSKYLR